MIVQASRVLCFLMLAGAALASPLASAQTNDEASEPAGLQVTDIATDPETEPPLACISFNERLAIGDQVDPGASSSSSPPPTSPSPPGATSCAWRGSSTASATM